MTLHPALAAAVALGGNFLLSLGMTLQKRYVSWIGAAGPRDAAFRRARLAWFLGFMLVNAVPAFNYVALLGLPPNVVGAASGSSVAFTAILAWPLLGERLGARRAILSGLLLGAIALAGLRGGAASDPAVGDAYSAAAIYAALALPLAAGALALALRARRDRGGRGSGAPVRGLAPLLAAVGGSFSGYMVLPMRAIQIAAGDRPAAWLGTPFPYLFLAGGLGGFAFAQLAYKEGEMSSVAPAFYGMQVLWPALASYLAFAAPLDPAQALAFAAIAACVVLVGRSD